MATTVTNTTSSTRPIVSPVRPADRFLVFGQPCIEAADIVEVVDSLQSRWLGTGPKVTRFERNIAEYKGVGHAVAVNSCTAGLHLACVALDLGPGDEVITTALTFPATVNAIIHCGATPVLADIDPISMNIDPVSIEAKITGRTRAVMVVHLAGRPCEMSAIKRLTDSYGLFLIEDCAHAVETEYRGQKAGAFGEFGVLSFYATKNITTGEGGMVLTNSPELASRVKQLSLHGLNADAWRRYSDSGYRHYFVGEAGYKYNMMDLQAAIGLHQLERIEQYAMRRQEIWARYMEAFAGGPLGLPSPDESDIRHAHHLFTVQVDEAKCGVTRDDFLGLMTEHNIGVGVHYLSVAEHPYYQQHFGWIPDEWPYAMRIGRETVSLPLSGCLGDDDVEDVICAVNSIVF